MTATRVCLSLGSRLARRDASRTLSEEEEAVRQAEAALQKARNRVDDPAFFTSDEEDASRPVRMQSEPLTLEAEEEMRRISQQREQEQAAFVAAVDQAASNVAIKQYT